VTALWWVTLPLLLVGGGYLGILFLRETQRWDVEERPWTPARGCAYGKEGVNWDR
jgi:hypothetical protein